MHSFVRASSTPRSTCCFALPFRLRCRRAVIPARRPLRMVAWQTGTDRRTAHDPGIANLDGVVGRVGDRGDLGLGRMGGDPLDGAGRYVRVAFIRPDVL